MNKKVLKRKIKFIGSPVKNTLMNTGYKRNRIYANFYETKKVVDNIILYESRDGKSITDSPYAIFKFLISQPQFKNYKHVWSVQDFKELEIVMNRYKELDNVIFVKRNSTKYLEYLATAKYLINNSTFQNFFIPKEEQIYINTWHGTPLKKMGFEIPGNPATSRNVVRNFLSSSILISPNEHTTDMYLKSYKLDGVYSGEIIEDGYPRIDLTLNTSETKLINDLVSAGLKIDKSKKNILYAPTWKGTNVNQARNDMEQIISDMNILKEKNGNEYNVLIKVHPFLYPTAKNIIEIKDILIPDYIDTNEMLSATDLLITDYSSIFFDYLVTDKPILFYMWDAEYYMDSRGSYIGFEELPGPVLYNIDELTEAVDYIEKVKISYQDNYSKMKEKFTKYDDGNVTSRLVEYIFNDVAKNITIINELDNKKEKIVFYPGGMMNNGITSSFLNLMDNIDYEKYDVSVFMKIPNKQEALKNIAKINKNARLLFKHGISVYTLNEIYRDRLCHNRGVGKGYLKKAYPEAAYIREAKRFFGKSVFSFAIDFSGYSLFWAKYLLATDAKRRICYMHNDILSDSERTINGKRPHFINLRGLMTVYNRFDKLVSVSKGTMELNKKNLGKYADDDKFDFVMNSILPEKIIEGSQAESYHSKNESLNVTSQMDSSEKFMARAVIDKPDNHIIWNNSFMNNSTKKNVMAKDFSNKEVTILWKADTNKGSFYKFSYHNKIVGWISTEALTLLPDSVIEKTSVKQVAVLERTKGNAIWSKPYKLYNTSRVSYSSVYKGMIIEVDKEVKTEHGFYGHFKLFGEDIGWIDTTAYSVVWDYTHTNLEKSEIDKKKRDWLRKNPNNFKFVSEHFSERSLRHRNISKLAQIINVSEHAILSALPINPKSVAVADYEVFLNSKVELREISINRDNVYYLAYYNDERLGWVNRKALKISSSIEMFNEKEVKKTAEIDFGNDYQIWTKPFGMSGSTLVDNDMYYADEEFEITSEARTQLGNYSQLEQKNKNIGWINSSALLNVKELGIEVGNTFIPEPDPNYVNFVNMGRLSPEKAQDNLINAFAKFHKEVSNSRLYILGSGLLYKDLQDQIKELELEGIVYLVGQLENPFKLLNKCNCFVLSSHYEGQPMVLLETMTLGLDIIATDIVANRTVLEDGKYGMLVEDSVEGLYQGLIEYNNRDKQIGAEFDFNQYNDEAMASFYKVINE